MHFDGDFGLAGLMDENINVITARDYRFVMAWAAE